MKTSETPRRWQVGVGRLAQVAAVIVIGAVAAGGFLSLRQSAVPNASQSPVVGPQATIEATASPSAAPTGTPGLAQYLVQVPTDKVHQVPLPAGAELNTDSRIAADGDWLVAEFAVQGAAPGHEQQLYAVNIATGASRRLADHSVTAYRSAYSNSQARGASVANGRVAWVDPTCTYTVSIGALDAVCTAWKLHLMDLATGVDRIVANGSISEKSSSAVLDYGDAVDVVPEAALSSDTLAYTTGNLKAGFKLHLLTISSGSERTVGLDGMTEDMRWVGNDLAWLEDSDLHHDGPVLGVSTKDYFADTRLMLLQAGSNEASQIDTNTYAFEADSSGIVWSDFSSGFCPLILCRTSGPDWTVGWVGPNDHNGYYPTVWPDAAMSSGWIGWSGGYNPSVYPAVEMYTVLRPQDSEPHVVRYGAGMSGGWLFLIPRDPATQKATGLEAVRISDLR
jgi:hypothetical protein